MNGQRCGTYIQWNITQQLKGTKLGHMSLMILLKDFLRNLLLTFIFIMGLPDDSVVKILPANAGDVGSIPGSGGSPREGNDNPLQ